MGGLDDGPDQPGRPGRLLLVHAHPDDESITTGATMARYAAEGVQVTLITCTRGEQGEVIPAGLAMLAAGGAGNEFGDALGEHRVGELALAMAALGVTDHRFLGDLSSSPGRPISKVIADGGTYYRDSGMAYAPDGTVVASLDPPPGSFAAADLDQAAGMLAELIRHLRPDVLISYDPGGGYGHPDHVRTHLLTMRAIELARETGCLGGNGAGDVAGADDVAGAGDVAGADEGLPWAVPKVYWVVPEGPAVTTAIDGRPFVEAKRAALAAHETQVRVTADGQAYALSNDVEVAISGWEFYRLVHGQAAGSFDDAGRERDLFAGI